jgi:hypothetical protein
MRRSFKLPMWTMMALALFFVFSLAACSADSEDVSTGSETNSSSTNNEKKSESENVKKYSINQDFQVNGLNVKIGDIKVQNNKVIVGLTLKNTTNDKLSFYPDQGNVVVGSMQLDADLFGGNGDVGGDIQAGVEKSGVIEFITPDGKSLNPNDVKEVELHFGDVFNENSMNSSSFDQKINLQ